MVGSLASTVCYDRRWKAWDPDRGMSWHTTCDAAKRSGGPFNKFICGWSARNQHSDNQKLRDHNDRSSSGAAAPERVIDALVQDPFDMKSGRTAAALCAFNAAIRDRIAQGRPIAGECAALHCMQLAPHHIEWRPPGPACELRDRPSLSSSANSDDQLHFDIYLMHPNHTHRTMPRCAPSELFRDCSPTTISDLTHILALCRRSDVDVLYYRYYSLALLAGAIFVSCHDRCVLQLSTTNNTPRAALTLN